jgi:molecular chaperone Hsp33
MPNDPYSKGRFEGLQISFSHVVATKAVNEAVLRHQCDPPAAHLLGRAMAGTLLATATLPVNHRLNAYWHYHGALRTIVVDAGTDGSVRAFIAPPHLSDSADGEALYGEMGDLQLVVSAPDGKIVSSGTTPVALHDVVDDLAYHYALSEQIETAMVVMIGFQPDTSNPVRICRGWMIQALPECDLERFERIRKRMGEPMFRKQLAEGCGDEKEIAELLAKDENDFKGIYSEKVASPHFRCNCSKEKMGAVLRSLPIPERMELVKEGKPVAIRCQFCNQLHELSLDECMRAWNSHLDQ